MVKARGQVKARVWYEGYGECGLHEEKLVLSGRKLSKIYIETPWKTVFVKGQRDRTYPFYRQAVYRKVLNSRFGDFGFYRVKIEEQVKQTRDFSQNEAIKIARKKALETLKLKMGEDGNVNESRVDILSRPSDPILRVRVSVETIEDIAGAQPINVSANGN